MTITGNGDKDIIGAITYAAKMKFRPKASKTFILLPCSNCSASNNLVREHSYKRGTEFHKFNHQLDYPFTNQMLAENDITLHILIDDDFSVSKLKAKKLLFGKQLENYKNKCS